MTAFHSIPEFSHAVDRLPCDKPVGAVVPIRPCDLDDLPADITPTFDTSPYLSLPQYPAQDTLDSALLDRDHLDHQRIPLGLDTYGGVVDWDMSSHPVMHITGSRGSGRTVLAATVGALSRRLPGVEVAAFSAHPFFASDHRGAQPVPGSTQWTVRLRQELSEALTWSRSEKAKGTVKPLFKVIVLDDVEALSSWMAAEETGHRSWMSRLFAGSEPSGRELIDELVAAAFSGRVRVVLVEDAVCEAARVPFVRSVQMVSPGRGRVRCSATEPVRHARDGRMPVRFWDGLDAMSGWSRLRPELLA